MEILALMLALLAVAAIAAVLAVLVAMLVMGLVPEVLEARDQGTLPVVIAVPLEVMVLVAVTVRALVRLVAEKAKVTVVRDTAGKGRVNKIMNPVFFIFGLIFVIMAFAHFIVRIYG